MNFAGVAKVTYSLRAVIDAGRGMFDRCDRAVMLRELVTTSGAKGKSDRGQAKARLRGASNHRARQLLPGHAALLPVIALLVGQWHRRTEEDHGPAGVAAQRRSGHGETDSCLACVTVATTSHMPSIEP